MKMLSLIPDDDATRNALLGRTPTFSEFPVHIGRSPHMGLILTYDAVSRTHCKISRSESGFTLTDMDSRNGSFLNGEKISQGVGLFNDDVIRIACFRFRVSIFDDASLTREVSTEESL